MNAEVHAYNTRAGTDLHVLGPRSTYGQRCIRYKRSMLCNRLPDTLKLPSSITVLNVILTRGQSNLTKSASRGANYPVRGHPRGSKFVPLNSWGRGSY